MYISINGKILSVNEAKFPLDSEFLMYGYGVFETIKFQDKKPHYLNEHLIRLKWGLAKLGISFDIEETTIRQLFHQLIEINKLNSGVLKITSAKNKDKQDIILSTGENKYTEKDYERGFKLSFTDIKRNPHSVLTYIKSNNYLENYIARKQALEKGYDEVLFTNIYDKIAEGAISNIFFIKNNTVYTPSIACGILPGIMRDKIINFLQQLGLSMKVGEYNKSDLLKADEVFITNSLMEVMPVSQIDGYKFDLQKYFVTKRIMQQYSLYIHDYYNKEEGEK